MEPTAFARELMAAYAGRHTTDVPLSTRHPAFDSTAAYQVEAELTRLRRASGRTTVGRKVGYANKALWRILKLETVAWAHMYDDTVQYADGNRAALDVDRRCAPKIEPEIVFKLGQPPVPGEPDPAAILASVEWLALGFEIIDCVFADWKFQPADFVASFGLHSGLIVGAPLRVTPENIPALADALARFEVRLSKNGEQVDQGSGKNVLRSPALCLGELAAAIARQPGAEPLAAGELISTGTLTESHRIGVGETWTAAVEGIDLPALTVTAGA